MPQKPPAPNPAPPPAHYPGEPEHIFAMHRWRYPLHHDCSHFRGYPSDVPTRCDNCKARDKVDDRRRIASAARAFVIAFVITLIGCCAVGGTGG